MTKVLFQWILKGVAALQWLTNKHITITVTLLFKHIMKSQSRVKHNTTALCSNLKMYMFILYFTQSIDLIDPVSELMCNQGLVTPLFYFRCISVYSNLQMLLYSKIELADFGHKFYLDGIQTFRAYCSMSYISFLH